MHSNKIKSPQRVHKKNPPKETKRKESLQSSSSSIDKDLSRSNNQREPHLPARRASMLSTLLQHTISVCHVHAPIVSSLYRGRVYANFEYLPRTLDFSGDCTRGPSKVYIRLCGEVVEGGRTKESQKERTSNRSGKMERHTPRGGLIFMVRKICGWSRRYNLLRFDRRV